MSAQAQAPLLSTKLHAPDARERIRRGALVARLSQASGTRLALIRAPAGWGKSTLLSQWRDAEAGRRPFAWLTLDALDNDPIRFWTYVIEALRAVAPSVGGRSLALVQAPGVDLTSEMLPVLVDELAAVPMPLVLALDDFHHLADGPVTAGVRMLLEYLPEAISLAVATRTEPPLPLARLRGRAQLVEVDAHQLGFSLGETEFLLNDVLGLGLRGEDIERLHQRAEGWPAGLYLAALSLRTRVDRHEFIVRFAGDDRHIVDYLGEEVLASVEPATRHLLLQTSILQKFNGPLCDAVLQTSGSARRLRELARSNFFIVPLDEAHDWYRYHHLFGACLNAELKLDRPALIAQLHRRASGWFQEAGQIAEAIDHAIAGSDFATATELVAEHWMPIEQSGGVETVERWLAELPETVVMADARLCLARAWTAFTKGRLDEVLPCAALAEHAPEPPVMPAGITSVASDAATLRASYWLRMGDFDQARRYASRAMTLEYGPWRAIAANCLGTASYWLDDERAAREQLAETVRLGADRIPVVAIFALGLLALIATEATQWSVACDYLAHAERLIDNAGGLGEYWVAANAELARGLMAERDGALDRAETAIARGVVLHRRGKAPVDTAGALLHLARIHRRQGLEIVAEDETAQARGLVAGCRAPGPRIVRMIARADNGARPTRPALTPTPADELSSRELDVLRLLATRLTQREIGRELYLTLNTVKSHTRTIFRKLDVSSREQAVARARELELI